MPMHKILMDKMPMVKTMSPECKKVAMADVEVHQRTSGVMKMPMAQKAQKSFNDR